MFFFILAFMCGSAQTVFQLTRKIGLDACVRSGILWPAGIAQRATRIAPVGSTRSLTGSFNRPAIRRFWGYLEISMSNKLDWVGKRRDLRDAAESILTNVRVAAEQSDPTQTLINELLIHKVELEVQLEELRRTNTALEVARDRYRELYEFSLVGYLTMTRGGMLVDANQTASALLQIDRQALGQRRFLTLVAPEDQDRWTRLFKNAMESADNEARSFCLKLQPLNGASFTAFVECQRQIRDDADSVMQLALVDFRKFATEDCRQA